MGTVHNIESATPHHSARIMCGNCKHEWVAVYPTTAKSIQCPECQSFVNEFGRQVVQRRCETCGALFTVCPAPEDLSRWKNCLSESCKSYNEGRAI